MTVRRIATGITARIGGVVDRSRRGWLADARRVRRAWSRHRTRTRSVGAADGRLAVVIDPPSVPRSEHELSDAVEDLIHRLDFATVAELRSAARVLDVVLQNAGRAEGRRIIEGLADLVVAEANHHEATIDHELATMLRPYHDGG